MYVYLGISQAETWMKCAFACFHIWRIQCHIQFWAKMWINYLKRIFIAKIWRIRGDMLWQPKPEGIYVSEDRDIDSIPDTLYMFLNLLLGGQRLLEDELYDDKNEARRRIRIISISQDIMYTANGDRFLTPKHIRMANTIHQATRSKELVNMFHKAGHVMSYRDIIKLDTALAKKTLETMNDDGAVAKKLWRVALFISRQTTSTLMNYIHTLWTEKEHSMPHEWLSGSAVHLKVISSLEYTFPRKKHSKSPKRWLT